jgi:hypothetical protein
MVMGSPGFTAPERIRGEDATPASDLWSLGATLYAAVEGHGPYENRGGPLTTMSAIINENAPAAPTAGALAPVIAALLRREPSDRPDAATATRMISDVLPLLPARTGPPPAGYEPTALAAASPPRAPEAGRPPPDLAALAAAGHPTPEDPVSSRSVSADTQGGEPPQSQTAPTTPQPVIGEAAQHEQPARHGEPPGYEPAKYDQRPQYDRQAWYDQAQAGGGQGGSSAGSPARAADPPPDFSSWYDPSPRSGASQARSGAAYQPGPAPRPAGAAPPRSGAAAQPGAPPDYGPGVRGKRRSGSWWKIALVVLAVVGAAAGAATVLLLRHDTTGTQSTSSSATLAPASTAPQIVNAINEQVTGAIPVGWRTYSQNAVGTEKAGFRLAAPVSWPAKVSGYQTYLRDPSVNANILIDLTPHTFPNDMLQEAEYIRHQSLAEDRFPGYTQLGLSAITIRGQPGSFWKFTWLDQGVEQEAIDLLFVLPTSSGSQSYALYMTAPESMWNYMRPTFDEEVETFIPLT